MAAVPPVSRDALTHHLLVPKLYVESGSFYELPEIIHSYSPQLLDLLYCIPLMVGNDIIPKYIHFSFALLTAILIHQYLKIQLNRNYALWGALFFLSLPVIIKLSVTVYVDLGLIFFSTAALLGLLSWVKSKFLNRWLILSGVYCGLALSTKYNGLVTFFILTAFTPIIYIKGIELCPDKTTNRNRLVSTKAILFGFGFMLLALLVFSPWMIKNQLWTGNPIYPLYQKFWEPINATEQINNISAQKMNHFSIRKFAFNEQWWETALIPVRIFFQGQDDTPKYFDGRLNPLLFILPIFALIATWKSKSHKRRFDIKILFSFSILYIIIAFLDRDMRIRYIGPAIPPLVILSVLGLEKLYSQYLKKNQPYRRILQITLTCILMSLFSLNLIYIIKLFNQIAPISYLSNKISRDAYIEKYRPEYSSLVFANQHLIGKVKILGFFLGDRGYYSKHEIGFDQNYFRQIIINSKTEYEVLKKLQQKGYTHFVVYYPRFNAWMDKGLTNFEKIRMLNFFKTYGKRLFTKGKYGLYELQPSSSE